MNSLNSDTEDLSDREYVLSWDTTELKTDERLNRALLRSNCCKRDLCSTFIYEKCSWCASEADWNIVKKWYYGPSGAGKHFVMSVYNFDDGVPLNGLLGGEEAKMGPYCGKNA